MPPKSAEFLGEQKPSYWTGARTGPPSSGRRSRIERLTSPLLLRLLFFRLFLFGLLFFELLLFGLHAGVRGGGGLTGIHLAAGGRLGGATFTRRRGGRTSHGEDGADEYEWEQQSHGCSFLCITE